VKSRDDEVKKRHHGYQRILSVLKTPKNPYYYEEREGPIGKGLASQHMDPDRPRSPGEMGGI
jgi:hypothetical protein